MAFVRPEQVRIGVVPAGPRELHQHGQPAYTCWRGHAKALGGR
jgi:hypothetical protein